MMANLNDRTYPAKAVNVTVIPLEQAPQGYAAFDKGVPQKFVLSIRMDC